MKMEGKFSVNWLKILVIGIPMLLIAASGVLSYSFASLPFSSQIGWIYVKYNVMGTTLIGVACGYVLLSSITKKEKIENTVQVIECRIAKIMVLFVLISSVFISL
ncbi:MAG: hypothetical protein RBT41_02180 [Clostridia bacterium]|nr:hypothetical protein [Clostridia bacterium]